MVTKAFLTQWRYRQTVCPGFTSSFRRLLRLLVGACAALLLGACGGQQSPTIVPSTQTIATATSAPPTSTVRPSTPTPAATPTPAPTPTPVPPALIAAAGDTPVGSLGPPDPIWRTVTLTREGGLLQVVPLAGSSALSSTLEGRPAGWSFDGQLLSYLATDGTLAVMAPSAGLTTTIVTASEELRPVAAALPPASASILYAAATDEGLAIRSWDPVSPTITLATVPGVTFAGGAELQVSPGGAFVALPVVTADDQRLRRILLVPLSGGAPLTLAEAPGSGPAAAIWSREGDLALSLGENIVIYRTAANGLQSIGVSGVPQDWNIDGMLVIGPDGHLLLWRENQPLQQVRSAGEPVVAQAARWIGRGEALVLRDGSVYRIRVP